MTPNSTAVIALALVAVAVATLSAQRVAPATGTNPAVRGAALTQAAQNPVGRGQVRVTKVRPNIYMLTGAGSNITVMPFDLGAVVVDTGSTAMAGMTIANQAAAATWMMNGSAVKPAATAPHAIRVTTCLLRRASIQPAIAACTYSAPSAFA